VLLRTKAQPLVLGLAEIPNVFDLMKALKNMPESDLKCIVLERLYVWHAAKNEGSLHRSGSRSRSLICRAAA
jgi:hypothetical protein